MKPQNSAAFREFRKSDGKTISRLMHALNREDSQELPLDKEKVNQLFRHAPKKIYVRLFVAEKSGKIIGYTIYNMAFSVEFSGMYGEIDEIYILPKYRNQGIGTKFILWLEKLSRKNKFHALYLVSTTQNTKAHGLYRRIGFEKLPEIGFIKMFYRKIRERTENPLPRRKPPITSVVQCSPR